MDAQGASRDEENSQSYRVPQSRDICFTARANCPGESNASRRPVMVLSIVVTFLIGVQGNEWGMGRSETHVGPRLMNMEGWY